MELPTPGTSHHVRPSTAPVCPCTQENEGMEIIAACAQHPSLGHPRSVTEQD